MFSPLQRLPRMLGLGAAAAGIALAVTPTAATQPDGEAAPCAGTARGNYCDTPIHADGSWTRCFHPNPSRIYVWGSVGYGPPEPTDCTVVFPHSLPPGSPPHHIQ